MDIGVVDPELHRATRRLPVPPVANRLVRSAVRWAGRRLLPAYRVDGVTVRDVRDGAVRVRVYEPAARASDAGLVWVHGGGLVIGSAKQDDRLCAETAAACGITVVSAEYRLAPEAPFPAALEDVEHAWSWVQANARSLGIDPARVVIGGESAGGGIAACLAQRLYDAGGTRPIAQWLFGPMLDDRTAARRDLDALDHWVWNNRANRFGWASYLGTDPGARDVPPYAVAARREDLGGLPAAWICVGDIELFAYEVRAYAGRLRDAGVDVVLDVIPGAPHGFENWAADTGPARALVARAHAWLGDHLGPARDDASASAPDRPATRGTAPSDQDPYP
ncbi:alpha/beta hydrolase [Microbacterium sp. 18062]|uniref:alpha/beta hydrolase n=1 Tax=Microbacterium sp. 18062 TaxID=2681410 RepID=UPI001357E6D5|nr:alpha/beta hydrolase [Microbacterium sp. 18062]